MSERSERTGAAAAGRAAAREAVATGRDQTPQGAEEQSGTRQRVARSILHHGPSTAAELAGRLGLTQAAVRRHLDALAAEGLVEPREKRVHGSRGRGRPAKAFALTDAGRGAFDQAYDELAVEALRWIERAAGGGEGGAAAVMAFARERADIRPEPGGDLQWHHIVGQARGSRRHGWVGYAAGAVAAAAVAAAVAVSTGPGLPGLTGQHGLTPATRSSSLAAPSPGRSAPSGSPKATTAPTGSPTVAAPAPSVSPTTAAALV